MKSVLKLWQFQNLTREGRLVVFKILAISKIVFQALTAAVSSHVIKDFEKKKKKWTSFLWITSNPKIKLKILCKNYDEGSIKYVDILIK